MSREDLILFARRDWAAIAEAKDQHWLREKRARPSADACRRSDDLLRHARAASSATPSLDRRLADLHTHQRVGLALRAVTRSSR